jgi:hypothetical protein
MKTAHIIKRLKEDTAYQEFFQKAMKKFDISSPTDLKDSEKKKNFFDYVDKNYSAKKEGRLREDYFPAHSTDSQDVKTAKAALANWFKNIRKNVPGMFPQVFDELHDLIDEYAAAYAEDYKEEWSKEVGL